MDDSFVLGDLGTEYLSAAFSSAVEGSVAGPQPQSELNHESMPGPYNVTDPRGIRPKG